MSDASNDVRAVISTDAGDITVEFLQDKAPKHVENFLTLARKGFYDETRFHRIIPGFMIQGGDPNTKTDDDSRWGTGGPGYTIKAEFNDVHHERGVLSMARSADPDSAGSQFFICVGDATYLDRQYTAFGKVTSGQEVADAISAVPRNADDRPDDEIQMVSVTTADG